MNPAMQIHFKHCNLNPQPCLLSSCYPTLIWTQTRVISQKYDCVWYYCKIFDNGSIVCESTSVLFAPTILIFGVYSPANDRLNVWQCDFEIPCDKLQMQWIKFLLFLLQLSAAMTTMQHRLTLWGRPGRNHTRAGWCWTAPVWEREMDASHAPQGVRRT